MSIQHKNLSARSAEIGSSFINKETKQNERNKEEAKELKGMNQKETDLTESGVLWTHA